MGVSAGSCGAGLGLNALRLLGLGLEVLKLVLFLIVRSCKLFQFIYESHFMFLLFMVLSHAEYRGAHADHV